MIQQVEGLHSELNFVPLGDGTVLFGSIFWVLAQNVRHYQNAEERFDKALSLGCIGNIAAILVHSLADFNLYIPANALMFAIILGHRMVHRASTEAGTEGEAIESMGLEFWESE